MSALRRFHKTKIELCINLRITIDENRKKQTKVE